MKLKKIKNGYTNDSYVNLEEKKFIQYKQNNGLNHKSDYKELSKLDFVPKLLENNDNVSIWEYIEGEHIKNPSNDDLEQIAKLLYKLHNSDIKFTKNILRKRIETYRTIMKKKNIRINIVEKLYKKINTILRNMDKSKPVHGDLYWTNMLKTKDNKIYFIDWEYSHMGDIHFELAYIIEAYDFNSEQEKIFLNAYGEYDLHILKKHKVLVDYLTVLWLYAQDTLHFSPEHIIKRLEKYYEEGF